jgi:hypothetical protein
MRLSIFQSKISGHCVQFLSVPFYWVCVMVCFFHKVSEKAAIVRTPI